MAVERLTKRTVFVSECPTCGDKQIRDEHPPRERLCACGEWVPFVPVSYIWPDKFDSPLR